MNGKISRWLRAGLAAQVALVLMLLVLMAAGSQAGASDWAEGSDGSVPKSAESIASGIYAVRGAIPSTAGKQVQYPGIIKRGASKAQVFGQAQMYRVGKYEVFLPRAKWVKGSAMDIPPGAVEFGRDGGPLYFIRATGQGRTCYGVLPANPAANAYVYCGNMPQAAYSFQVLCQ